MPIQDMEDVEAVLSALSDQDREDLIRLPFRVGMWISSSDSTGGEESEYQELRALENIIEVYAEEYLKSQFVQSLIEKTFLAKASWPAWVHDIKAVPAECVRLMEALDSLLSPREMSAFRDNLIDIAVAVAMAFREEPSELAEEGFFQPILRAFGLSGAIPYGNISRAERKALRKLAVALKVKDPIQALSG